MDIQLKKKNETLSLTITQMMNKYWRVKAMNNWIFSRYFS